MNQEASAFCRSSFIVPHSSFRFSFAQGNSIPGRENGTGIKFDEEMEG
jgi:hypothetical protein